MLHFKYKINVIVNQNSICTIIMFFYDMLDDCANSSLKTYKESGSLPKKKSTTTICRYSPEKK